MKFAVLGRNFEVLLYLRENGLSDCTTKAAEACMFDYFKIAEWLFHHHPRSFDAQAVRARIEEKQQAPRWKRLFSQLE